MRFCKILSYSDEGILVTHLPLLFGILVGGAVCRLLWNAGLKYPGTLIGVFFVGMTLTFIPGNLVMSNFSAVRGEILLFTLLKIAFAEATESCCSTIRLIKPSKPKGLL